MQQPTSGDFNQQVTTMQIIIGALAMGPLTFALVALLTARGEPTEGPLTKIALVMGLGAIFLSGPVRRLLQAKAQNSAYPIGVYQTALIVSAAILEGGVLMNLVAHMQERSNWTLAMAALLWVSLLLKMPTRVGVTRWLEQEGRRQRDEAVLRG